MTPEEGCLEEWVTVVVNEEYSEHDLVSLVQGSNDCEREEAPTDVVTYTDAVSALEIALCLMEQHPPAKPNGVLLMRCWFGIVSTGIFSSPCQMKITDFM